MIGVVLLSGGIDSAVTLGIAKEECSEVKAIHFDYGQATNQLELKNSREISSKLKTEIIEADVEQAFSHFCSGTMIKKEYDSDSQSDQHGQSTGYVHMRNLILLSIAGAMADSRYSDEIINLYIGAQEEDADLYPDCRPGFINSTEEAINKSTNRNTIEIKAPLIDKTKSEIINIAREKKIPLESTISCYNLENGDPCMECPACIERKKGFKEAGIEDPATET